ncbi:heavy metal transporter [Candidatus Woesearchaeota archaeon]|nr:heavy metal transporter [Candidatus Woesearchaeota archaeon]|tara:strand:+ start:4394 stop:4600 length:207 start_codon:yes stop_codon:yes gene_type:complete
MKNITLNVKGMHCSSCEILIKDSLEETEGISNAEVSHKDGTAEVSFDESKTDEELIKTIIAKEGYNVE